jgi:hypothetical protein
LLDKAARLSRSSVARLGSGPGLVIMADMKLDIVSRNAAGVHNEESDR